MMDYVYRPEVAAQIAEYVGYFTPVSAVPAIVLQHAKEAADAGDTETAEALGVVAETVTPTKAQVDQTYGYKVLDEAEEREWNELFNEVIAG
jgi:spermidine/putrescine-binding protein